MGELQFYCPRCGRRIAVKTPEYCCACGGAFELDFAPPAFDLALVDSSQWGLFRYRAFLPLPDESWRAVTMGEGMTPVLPLDAQTLVKLEYAMPTLSFKDRGAALVISLCKSLGVQRVLQDSSGNAGNSIAAYAARAGMECEIFVPRGTSPAKIDMIRSYGAEVVVFEGTRDETAEACRQKAKSGAAFYASHVFNPFFYQGTKTYVYEVYEQLGRLPDNLFVPVGNGTLYLGVHLALDELEKAGLLPRRPTVWAVQSERCAPILRAFEAGEKTPADIKPLPTLAEGIAIGRPVRGERILQLARAHGDRFVSIAEAEILPARRALAERGFFVEHTTAATYAAYLACQSRGDVQGDSLLPLCGAGLKSQGKQ